MGFSEWQVAKATCVKLYCFVSDFIVLCRTLLFVQSGPGDIQPAYSTVTDFARLRGLSTSVPRASAVWYASNCSATTCRIGDKSP